MLKSVKINLDHDEDDEDYPIPPPDILNLEGDETIIDFPMKKVEIMNHNVKKSMNNNKENNIESDNISIIESQVNDEHDLLQKTFNHHDSEFYYNFFVCCWRRPIMKLALYVSYMSSISFMANLISLIAVGSSTSLHFALEAIILVIEFFCLLLLYYSISHNTPKFMKPYMIFGAIWNIFLVLLWLFCLAELIKGESFSFRVSSALSQIFIPSRRNSYYSHQKDSIMTTILMLFGLGSTIIINFWLLHIIVLAYFYLKQLKRNTVKYIQTQTTPPSSPIFV